MNILFLNTDNIQPLSVGDNINFFTRSTGNIIAGSSTTNLFSLNAKSIQLTGQTSLTGNIAINGNTTTTGNISVGTTNIISTDNIQAVNNSDTINLYTNTTSTINIGNTAAYNSTTQVYGLLNVLTSSNTGLFYVRADAQIGHWTGSTDTWRITSAGAATFSSIINQSPVSLMTSSAVASYLTNYSGTTVTPNSTVGYYYLVFGTVASITANWTPTYTNANRLTIPYTGIYTISYTLHIGAQNAGIEPFISRNNGGDCLSQAEITNGHLLAFTTFNSNTTNSFESNISGTCFLFANDYVNIGFYLFTGSLTGISNRCVFSISLIQRSS